MTKILCTLLLLFSFNANATQSDYNIFVSGLKKELIKKGADKNLVNKVYQTNFYKEKPQAIKLDKKQNEFVLTTPKYLSRAITQTRLNKARKEYKEKNKILNKAYQKYGVPPQILISFWAIETNFGTYKGSFNAFEVLTQLAYDKRRRTFFKNQLFHLFKVTKKNKLDYKNIKSSWAGAMGHFQFMPSTWDAYGSGDIINNFNDAVLSAGNYLNKAGWQKDEAWGDKVTLPKNFDYNLVGRLKKKKTMAEWRKLGIKSKLKDKYKAALIMPDGKTGNAYLVTKNFDVIMKWNRSQNYALAIGILSDYIKNNNKLKEFK